MDDIITVMIAEGLAKNEYNAEAIVKGLHLAQLPMLEEQMKRARIYREWRRAGENTKAAFERAIRGEKAPERMPL